MANSKAKNGVFPRYKRHFARALARSRSLARYEAIDSRSGETMKLAKFRLTPRDYNETVALAEAAGVSFAEFVRQAVAEKAHRQRAIASVNSVRAELSDLLADIRQENAKSRRELSDDATKLMTTSLRKNEELTKTLVMELARSLGGGGKSEPGYGRTDWPV